MHYATISDCINRAWQCPLSANLERGKTSVCSNNCKSYFDYMVNTDPLRLTKNKGWNKERGKKALTRTYDIQNFIIPIRSRFVVDGMFGSMLSSEL